MTTAFRPSVRQTSTVSPYDGSRSRFLELLRGPGTGGTVLLEREYEAFYAILHGLSRTSTFGNVFQDKREVSTSQAIHEIRLKTGLTWEQLSKIFHVDRRSLHFWASGKSLSASHEEQLFRLLRLVRMIDRGSARANRAILLNPLGKGNQSPFEKLISGDYEEVLTLIGSSGVTRRRPPMASAEQVANKLPASPFSIDGVIDDSSLPTSGIYRASKRARVNRGKFA